MPRKKTKVQVPVLTAKRVTRQVLRNNTTELLVKEMPQLKRISLTMDMQSTYILQSVDAMQSTEPVIADMIERLKRNALSNRLLCSMLEDNVNCMKDELQTIYAVLKGELNIEDESTH